VVLLLSAVTGSVWLPSSEPGPCWKATGRGTPYVFTAAVIDAVKSETSSMAERNSGSRRATLTWNVVGESISVQETYGTPPTSVTYGLFASRSLAWLIGLGPPTTCSQPVPAAFRRLSLTSRLTPSVSLQVT
jgi:hypothetical protein